MQRRRIQPKALVFVFALVAAICCPISISSQDEPVLAPVLFEQAAQADENDLATTLAQSTSASTTDEVQTASTDDLISMDEAYQNRVAEVQSIEEEAGAGTSYEAGEVLVSLEDGVTVDQVNDMLATMSGVTTRSVTDSDIEGGCFVANVALSCTVSDAATELETSDIVAGAQPNYLYTLNDGAMGNTLDLLAALDPSPATEALTLVTQSTASETDDTGTDATAAEVETTAEAESEDTTTAEVAAPSAATEPDTSTSQPDTSTTETDATDTETDGSDAADASATAPVTDEDAAAAAEKDAQAASDAATTDELAPAANLSADAQSVSINDKYAYSKQWALSSVKVYQAWSTVKCNNTVGVAIIDTGCLTTHEDLKSNIKATYNAYDGTSTVTDTAGHGTHVAGIVSARTNNAKGTSGTSYNANLVIVKATTPGGDSFSTTTLAKAYAWINSNYKTYNIRVVNMSLGGYGSLSTDDALYKGIDKAKSNGILTVCAAGNLDWIKDDNAYELPYAEWPGDYDSCLSVINLKVNTSGTIVSRALGSNYNLTDVTKNTANSTKDISAPGSSIYSTENGSDGDYYGYMSGTSMASPCVAGIAALIFAENSSNTPAQVMDVLEQTATDLGTSGWDREYGYGEVNAAAAVLGTGGYITGDDSAVLAGNTLELTAHSTVTNTWTWKSSNTSVATVNSSGVVTGKAGGTVTITATGPSGTSVKATCTITVITASISGASSVGNGSTTTYSVSASPSNLSWKYTVAAGTGTATIASSSGVLKGTKAGTVTVTATCTAHTSISVSKTITVVNASITGATNVTYGKSSTFSVTGVSGTPSWKVTSNTGTGTISSAGVFVGTSTGKVTITATVSGTVLTKDVTIVGISVSTATVSSISNQSYTGSAIVPTPTVTCDGKTLTKDKDYTLSGSNNVKVGTATLTITGKGNYSGTTTTTFKIVQANIASATSEPIVAQTWTGGSLSPKPTVTYYGKTLSYGTDYALTYSNNVVVGTGTVTASGKGNFTGTKSVNFDIVKPDVADATVTISSSPTYSGTAFTPTVSVKYNSKTLVKDEDYTVAYSNNVNAGTANVTITGIGNYTGTKVAHFTINARNVSSAVVSVSKVATRAYTGSAQQPTPTVTYNGKTLTKGTDYTLSYKNNVNAGTATISITGKGNYTGTKNVAFTITARDFTQVSVSSIASQTYTGSAIEPTPLVRYGSTTLKAGTDYTLSYSNNTRVGTATVTLTGKGNYKGTKTATFKIVNARMTRLWGNTAMDTMSSIVTAGWSTSKYVVIATSEGYWDALAASSLAGKLGCPVLLCYQNSLPSQTSATIKRLGATTAYVMGGTSAVSNSVANAVKACGCTTVTRVAGDNAAGTARAAAALLGSARSKTCIIATSDGYWDALAASPYSYWSSSPIFLTEGGSLSSSTLLSIRAQGYTKVVVCGGTAAVPAKVVSQLAGIGLSGSEVTRLGGNTAVETSAKVASYSVGQGMSADGVAVATVDGYWDALTGAALCGSNGSVLVLASDSNRSSITGFVASKASSISHAYVFGGTAAVSDGTYNALSKAIG